MVDSLVITGVRPIQTEEGTITIVEGWNDYEVKEKHFYLEEELYSVVTFDGEDGIFWEVFDHGVVPTHVGVNRLSLVRRSPTPRCPHARGGESEAVTKRKNRLVLSPRTWG